MEILLDVSRIPNKYVITQREDVGHSSALEMKKNGMGRTLTSQKEDGDQQAKCDD